METQSTPKFIVRFERKAFFPSLFLTIVWLCVGCSTSSAPRQTSPASTSPGPVNTPIPRFTPTSTLTPTPKFTPTPTITPSPTPDPSCISGSLADTPVTKDVALLYQPDGKPVGAPPVTKGRCVVLFGKDDGKDPTNKWYRVLWADFAGWIRANATNFPASKLSELRAPPPCAKPRSITQGLKTEWTSDYSGRVVVVIDLYRAKMGTDYPTSTFQIKVNGAPVAGKDRVVASRGQFLMRSTPIGVNVKQGDRIGFTLRTSSQETVKLFVTYFAVPDGCSFDDK